MANLDDTAGDKRVSKFSHRRNEGDIIAAAQDNNIATFACFVGRSFVASAAVSFKFI